MTQRGLNVRHDSRLSPVNEDGRARQTANGVIAEIALVEICEPHQPLPPREQRGSGDDPAKSAQALAAGLFQDIPRSIWATFLAGWAGFFLLMWLFFAVDSESTFAVTVVLLFGVMAFGLPIVLARQSRGEPGAPCEVIETHTGPVSVRAAAAQIALIPIAVFLGFLGFIIFAK